MNARNNDGEKETLDFLAKPGNFETAFEVYEKFSEVLKSLQKKFWAQVRRMIEEKVRESPAKFDGWVCLPKEKQEDQPFFDVGLAPLNRNAMSYCYLCLGQTTARDKFGLRYGIYLGIQDVKKRPPEISQAVLGLPEFETLKSYLQEKHFKVRKEEWWIGYKELERLYDPQFLNELNRYDKTDEAKLQLLVGELFSLFEQARKMMDALNIALARE